MISICCFPPGVTPRCANCCESPAWYTTGAAGTVTAAGLGAALDGASASICSPRVTGFVSVCKLENHHRQ